MINHQSIGKKRIHLTEVDSTNNYTKDLVRQSVISSGLVVSAGFQSVGKGQRGNSWEGDPDKNIFMSCYLRFQSLPVERHFDINRWVSLAIYETVSRWIPRDKIRIKWPNDIYISNKKVAGMLSENSLNSSMVEASIIGIGLNVNQEKFATETATSMQQVLEQPTCVESVLAELISQLRRFASSSLSNMDDLRERYDGLLFRKDEPSNFYEGEQTFNGTIKGTNAKGQLIVEIGEEQRKFDIQNIRYQL